jgi:hypothetical protein
VPAAPALRLMRREMGRRETGVSHSSSLERSALESLPAGRRRNLCYSAAAAQTHAAQRLALALARAPNSSVSVAVAHRNLLTHAQPSQLRRPSVSRLPLWLVSDHRHHTTSVFHVSSHSLVFLTCVRKARPRSICRVGPILSSPCSARLSDCGGSNAPVRDAWHDLSRDRFTHW